MIEKLIGALMLGKTIVNVSIVPRFVLALANVVGLAVISAFLCCAFLASGLYVIHLELLSHGLDPTSAALVMFALVTVLAVACCALTVVSFHNLKNLAPYKLHVDLPKLLEIPQLNGVTGVIQSFLDGLASGSRPSTRP